MRRSAREVGAAGAEDPLAVGVVRQRVEQVLERQVGVAPRDRFAERDVQDDFDRGGKHISFSFFDRRAQRIARLAGQRRDRLGLGFGDFPRIDAGDAAAVQVHLHHDPVGLGRRFLEQRLEHLDHELHRRVVVVQQDDLVERRILVLVSARSLTAPSVWSWGPDMSKMLSPAWRP